MRHFTPQPKKGIIRFIGCLIIPFVLLGSLLRFGIHDYNITGLLNLKGYELQFHLLAIGILIWMDYLLSQIMRKEQISFRYLVLLNLLILLSFCVPYQEGKSLVSTVHITCAYIAFACFTCLFFYLLRIYPKHLTFFLMTVIFCVCLCLSAGKVTGIAEVIFASCVSILLSILV